jgi:hypothetical protein
MLIILLVPSAALVEEDKALTVTDKERVHLISARLGLTKVMGNLDVSAEQQCR